MQVHGYTNSGSIQVSDGDILWDIPDDMAQSMRYRVWDEWEMGPRDAFGVRVRVNTIPPYAPPPIGFKPIPKYDFWRSVDVHLHLTKDQVLDAIDKSAMDAREKYRARLGITDAQTYIRDDPNVVSMLSLMGFETREADAFWLWAQPA